MMSRLCLWFLLFWINARKLAFGAFVSSNAALAPPHATKTTITQRHHRRQQEQQHAFLDPSMIISSLETSDNASPLAIQNAFSVATFFPQPFWLLMILFPNWKGTKQIMGGFQVIAACCFVHMFIIVSSTTASSGTAPLDAFNAVFDPTGDPQAAFLNMVSYPNFVTEEWSHVLTWDLFLGRWIWLDGLKRNIFTSHSVLLCNLIGPPGLLLHWATCLVTGKDIMPQELQEKKEQEQ